MRNVIIDVDAGVDDALGLFVLLAHSPDKINILGITCVNGNTSVDNVCKNTLYVLSTANRPDIPVYRGALEPLIVEDEELCSDLRHFFGVNGFGDVPLPDIHLPKLQEENAIQALYRLAKEHQGQVTLVCFGPLTNIALAIKTYPDFLENVKTIFAMGGNYTAMGNTTMAAEFNFHVDPEAAKIVITSAVDKLILLPWETCYSLSIPYEWRTETLGKCGGDAIVLLNIIENSVLERAKKLGLNNWTSCDSLLAAIVLDSRIAIHTFSLHATVELSGKYTRGQLVVDHLNRRRHNIRIIKEIDQSLLQTTLLSIRKIPLKSLSNTE